MHEHLLTVSAEGTRKTTFAHAIQGEEKFAFLYVAISALVLAVAMTYSSIAGLSGPQTALLLVGGLIGAWATVFTLLEIRRLGQTPKERADEALIRENPYFSRSVTVQPPTGDPCPHHEDYPESAGLDQGQLTSRTPEPTPFIEDLLAKRRRKE